jgi:hypothetical protein
LQQIAQTVWSLPMFIYTPNGFKKYSLKPVAHACNPTQEAKIRRIAVWSQPRQIVCKTLFGKKKKKKAHKKSDGGVSVGVGPEFKPQYHKNRKKGFF